MSSLIICAIVFACLFGGAMLGMILRPILPAHHLSKESQDVLKVGTGLIATMAALVLGLLVASAKGSFDTQKAELGQLSANVILLDRLLRHYGPETNEIRRLHRDAVAATLERMWPEDGSPPGQSQPTTSSEMVFEKIQRLEPRSETQRYLHHQALKLSMDMAQTRWLLFAQRSHTVPMVFLVIVVFWMTIVFISFSFYAPTNATVFVTLLMCALSVATALFLILDLDRPFAGMIQISADPLRNALRELGQSE